MEPEIYDLLMSELQKTSFSNDVPVAALIVDQHGKISSVAHNTRELNHEITGHAELTLINQIASQNNNLKLDEYSLYVTLEPCAMCYSAAKQANIKHIYYLLDNNKNYDTKLLTLHDDKINLATFGTKKMQDGYRQIINSFFESHR